MITQIMINFRQILIWPVRSYNMYVPNLKPLGQFKTELRGKEVG